MEHTCFFGKQIWERTRKAKKTYRVDGWERERVRAIKITTAIEANFFPILASFISCRNSAYMKEKNRVLISKKLKTLRCEDGNFPSTLARTFIYMYARMLKLKKERKGNEENWIYAEKLKAGHEKTKIDFPSFYYFM